MAAFIAAIDLRKTYRVGKVDVPALRGVSFNVEKGEFVSVVGPSGSGKSTLFYLLGGLTRADSGKVVLDGDDFTVLSDAERTRMRKRKIGFVFQKFNLLPTLNARSNIAIAQEISGNGDKDPAFFLRICDLLGLTKRLDHRPSGALRRRATTCGASSRPGQQAFRRTRRRAHGKSRHREFQHRFAYAAAIESGTRPDRPDDHAQSRSRPLRRPHHPHA